MSGDKRGIAAGACAAFAVFALAFILFSGSLGLVMPQDCTAMYRSAERMNCYYGAAITQAYLCGATARGTQMEGDSYSSASCSPALNLCEEVYRYGSSAGSSSQAKKAETMANTCYFEVAKITRDPYACTYIDQEKDSTTELAGGVATRDMCLQEAQALANLAPENYFSSNPNNICAVVFVLPLLLGAILSRCP